MLLFLLTKCVPEMAGGLSFVLEIGIFAKFVC